MALPHALILQERETGVVGLNDGVQKEGIEDLDGVEEEGESQSVEQEVVEVVVQKENDEVAEVIVSVESTPVRQRRSEVEAIRDLLRQLEANPGPVKEGEVKSKLVGSCFNSWRKILGSEGYRA